MRKTSIVLLLLTLLTACGQRGPLYLPEQAQKPKTNTPQQAPVSETTAGQGAEPQPDQSEEQ